VSGDVRPCGRYAARAWHLRFCPRFIRASVEGRPVRTGAPHTYFDGGNDPNALPAARRHAGNLARRGPPLKVAQGVVHGFRRRRPDPRWALPTTSCWPLPNGMFPLVTATRHSFLGGWVAAGERWGAMASRGEDSLPPRGVYGALAVSPCPRAWGLAPPCCGYAPLPRVRSSTVRSHEADVSGAA
jgi:hypothetical protein